MINENITYVNDPPTDVNDPPPEEIGDKKEFKTGCPKTGDDENKELIRNSSNNHNHILKDNSHNHVGRSVDNSNNFTLIKNEYNSHILYDNASSNVPYVTNIGDTVLDNITIDSASADIPEHNHTMDPSGSHIHTFENDDDETCPNFIYMLPCIKF